MSQKTSDPAQESGLEALLGVDHPESLDDAQECEENAS